MSWEQLCQGGSYDAEQLDADQVQALHQSGVKCEVILRVWETQEAQPQGLYTLLQHAYDGEVKAYWVQNTAPV